MLNGKISENKCEFMYVCGTSFDNYPYFISSFNSSSSLIVLRIHCRLFHALISENRNEMRLFLPYLKLAVWFIIDTIPVPFGGVPAPPWKLREGSALNGARKVSLLRKLYFQMPLKNAALTRTIWASLRSDSSSRRGIFP